ncbi:DNA-processing protein DprA [Bifidobacterium leontopitheci]
MNGIGVGVIGAGMVGAIDGGLGGVNGGDGTAGVSGRAGTAASAATVDSGAAGACASDPAVADSAVAGPDADAGRLDERTLALAVLTFCLNTADAMMTALLKGAGDPVTALRLIRESSGTIPGGSSPGSDGTGSPRPGTASKEIERVFCTGLSRWGTKPTPRMMQSFRASLAGWHHRLEVIPTWDADELASWFTMDGGQWIIGPHHPCWPHMLDDLTTIRQVAAPLCLWGRGDMGALVACDAPIGIVGSRGANDYGISMARTIAECAAADGHTVVSGGAMGIDAAAHWGALAAQRGVGDSGAVTGRTVAVFAGGLNHMGPQRNAELFARIEAEGGALVSEMCPGTIPEARRFLARNRIIAALSSTLVVAQARLRSGALSTAAWAGDLNRLLVALPGDIDRPGNAGCNRLIHDGKAILLDSLDHVADMCHAAHAAEPVGGDTSAEGGAADGSQPEVTAGMASDAATAGGSVRLTAQQRDIVAVIRRLRRRGGPVTVQSVTEETAAHCGGADDLQGSGMPDGAAGSGAGDRAALRRATARLLPQVLAQLGQLEMMGVVVMDGGDISVVRAAA